MGEYRIPRYRGTSGVIYLGAIILFLLLSTLNAQAGNGSWGAVAGIGDPNTDVNVPIYLQLTFGQTNKAAFFVTVTPNGSAPPIATNLIWHTTIAGSAPFVGNPATNRIRVAWQDLSSTFSMLTAPTDATNGQLGYVTVRIPAGATPGQSYTIAVEGSTIDPVAGSFAPAPLSLTNGVGVRTTLTINGSNGTVSVNGTNRTLPYSATFAPWDSVHLEAYANSDYGFAAWAGDLTGTNPVADVLTDVNKTITANFVRMYWLTLTSCGNGPTLGGIGDVKVNGQLHVLTAQFPTWADRFPEGSSITLQAIPKTGWRFDYWWQDGILGTENPITLTMNSGRNISIDFFTESVPTHSLTVATNPADGSGGSTTPAGATTQNEGASVSISATPALHWRFVNWTASGNVSIADPNSASTTATIGAGDSTVTANFTHITHTVTLTANPSEGAASLTGDGTYNEGSTAIISATAAAGYRFTGWSGGLTGSTNPATFIVDADKNITANFVRQYTLTASFSPGVGGTVKPTSGTYDSGTPVNVSATANVGYQLDHWTVNNVSVAPDNPLSVVMDADKTVVAYFSSQQVTLTTSVSPTGGGSVGLNPPDGTYNYGASVTVTATANTGYRFDHWTGDLSGTSSSANITMNGDKSVTAVFIQQYTLTTSISPLGAAQ